MNSVIMVSEQISEDVVDNTRDILLGHVIVGRYTSPLFNDNQMIETSSPYKTKIRINTYNTPLNVSFTGFVFQCLVDKIFSN